MASRQKLRPCDSGRLTWRRWNCRHSRSPESDSLVSQHGAEGRFNEALAELDELRRLFVDAGDVTQAVQTALEETILLEWLGDYDRALETLLTAGPFLDPQIGADVARDAQADHSIDAARAALMQARGYTGDAGLAGAELVRRVAVERASVELLETRRVSARRVASTISPQPCGSASFLTTRQLGEQRESSTNSHLSIACGAVRSRHDSGSHASSQRSRMTCS